ncbi:hypothetical protein CLU79DRAFT_758921 [Phycomyces nitens]|nr:hypothetical protein CLU79DRAFT_758921 [Phycomyces nitens]
MAIVFILFVQVLLVFSEIDLGDHFTIVPVITTLLFVNRLFYCSGMSLYSTFTKKVTRYCCQNSTTSWSLLQFLQVSDL